MAGDSTKEAEDFNSLKFKWCDNWSYCKTNQEYTEKPHSIHFTFSFCLLFHTANCLVKLMLVIWSKYGHE